MDPKIKVGQDKIIDKGKLVYLQVVLNATLGKIKQGDEGRPPGGKHLIETGMKRSSQSSEDLREMPSWGKAQRLEIATNLSQGRARRSVQLEQSK